MHGISKTVNLVLTVLFVMLGILLEILTVISQAGGTLFHGWNLIIDPGAVMLFCAAMFPGQLVTSLDVILLAQSSPCKKKIQTDFFCLLTLAGNLAVMTVIVVIRLIGAAAVPEQSAALLEQLPVIGIIGFLLILYSGVMYKFFILALIVLYVIMMAGGSYVGFGIGMGKTLGIADGSLTAIVSILLSFALVLVGCGLQYLLAKAAYKRPL